MKYIFSITLFASLFFCSGLQSQSVQFVYAPAGEEDGDCMESTSCFVNKLCYYVEYTPGVTGTLTSYTLGFIGNCADLGPPILSTASCDLQNNSNVINACDQSGQFLIQVSASGVQSIVANTPVNIGQVCFEFNNGYDLELVEDIATDLTTSVDSINNNNSMTEYLDYDTQTLSNEDCKCFKLAANSGSPSQDNDCLMPITPIIYELNNCDTALISNLPFGLTAEVANNEVVIEGTPTHGGEFTFVMQAPDDCDCTPSVNNMEVDESVVMIFNKCYTKVEDALGEYNSGETIDILGNLITNPTTLGPLNNIILRVHKNVKWEIKN